MERMGSCWRRKSVFLLVFLVGMFLMIPCVNAHAEGEFQPDENGVYHIKNIDDWNAFFEVLKGGDTFSEKTVVLDNDIQVQGKIIEGCTFTGNFDGNGNTITYINDDITTTSAVFPIGMQGVMKNINIYVKDCVLDATKHDGNVNGTILTTNGGTMFTACTIENIHIYGDIKVIPDPSKNNIIECSGLGAGFSSVKNCTVKLIYDVDENKLNSFLENTNNLGLKLRLSQFGSKLAWKMEFHNCTSLGGYSNTFKESIEKLDTYYNSIADSVDDQFSLITHFGGEKDGFFASSVENCYYNGDDYPQFVCGKDSAKQEALLYYLDDGIMAKSTADLKKQETYVDYDFENVWGISEYINDGYPYLRALVNPELVALVEQIAALPEPDKLTKEDKEKVEQIKAALKGLSDNDKAQISLDALEDKVAKAEETIKAMEDDQKPEGDTEKQDPAEKTTEKKAVTTISVKKGTSFKIKGYKYKVTGVSKKNPTVTITGYKNKKLKKISISATVTYKKVKFKVTAIGNNAFKGQKKAAAVTIGANVKTIGKTAFGGDAKAKKFIVKTKVLKKVGAKAFKGVNKKAVIKVPAKKLKAYKKLLKGKGLAKTVKIK